MVVLGIETAGDSGGAALISAGGEYEVFVALGRAGGELLPKAVDTLLGVAEVRRDQIELLAVDIGPGSFTGLRIGVAFANGMAQALDIPVVGVRQTEAVARPVGWWPGKVAVWIHDRREFVYAAWATQDRVGAETVLPWSDALAKVRDQPGTLLVGSGAVRFRNEVRTAAPEVVCAAEVLARPRPAEVARLGLNRFQSEGAAAARRLEPHYVHKED